ncbi:hypothetical protein OE903_04210 [Bacillus sp. B6(2022)]|nr:hypothetical protein [Bacillus sp. B6(2022)]
MYDHELTDPRISYTKRMHLIHEHAKRFARGCIDQSGSVMTIHQQKGCQMALLFMSQKHIIQ